MYDRFPGFIKFWSNERNTEKTILYFNEESDGFEENTCDNEVFWSSTLQHRKKRNIFTFQLLIYYIQYYNRKPRLMQIQKTEREK